MALSGLLAPEQQWFPYMPSTHPEVAKISEFRNRVLPTTHLAPASSSNMAHWGHALLFGYRPEVAPPSVVAFWIRRESASQSLDLDEDHQFRGRTS